MGFLKRVPENAGELPRVAHPTGFDQLSDEQIEAHLKVARYGDFVLTDAVRPSFDLQVLPVEGYRRDTYRDEETGAEVPVLMAAASHENLFELFMDLVEPLGNVMDVVLETSHDSNERGHRDLYREHIDAPVLKSIFWEYEDMLVNDGCAGVAVLNPALPLEIQFDEHKLLIMYGNDLSAFEAILEAHHVRCDQKIKFITEAEHVHSSSDEYGRQFDELAMRLGAEHQSPTMESRWD